MTTSDDDESPCRVDGQRAEGRFVRKRRHLHEQSLGEEAPAFHEQCASDVGRFVQGRV